MLSVILITYHCQSGIFHAKRNWNFSYRKQITSVIVHSIFFQQRSLYFSSGKREFMISLHFTVSYSSSRFCAICGLPHHPYQQLLTKSTKLFATFSANGDLQFATLNYRSHMHRISGQPFHVRLYCVLMRVWVDPKNLIKGLSSMLLQTWINWSDIGPHIHFLDQFYASLRSIRHERSIH